MHHRMFTQQPFLFSLLRVAYLSKDCAILLACRLSKDCAIMMKQNTTPHPTNRILYLPNSRVSKQQPAGCKDPKQKNVLIQIHRRRTISAIVCIFLFLLGCDIFLARPILHERGMSETEVLNDFLIKSMLGNLESRLGFLNATMPLGHMSHSSGPKNPNPGHVLAQKGASWKHPVIMIPGFITSGLELWAGEECANRNFRRRFWGSLPISLSFFFSDNECWRRHLSLDPLTGTDPPYIKLRSAQGFEAADYMSSFWVWDKLIENLADVGYDGSNMMMMSYDWRLSFDMLEKRDGYFTKLRFAIEAYKKTTNQKVVLTAHSMGSQVVLYFFKWISTKESGGGGGAPKNWIETHIHAFINIAGPLLGVPKAVPALLSGEMKDTAALLGPTNHMVEHFFGRKNRRDLWQTWGSLWYMLPRGGTDIWGTRSDILTQELDTHCQKDEPFIIFNNGDDSLAASWTVEDSIRYLLKRDALVGNNIHAIKSLEALSDWKKKSSKENWHDPTITALPHAQSMKIYCLYGVGIQTERSYFYKRGVDNIEQNASSAESTHGHLLMDASVNDPLRHTRHGTRFSDGDVSVPLVSLGLMCVDGWKNNRQLNPSKINVITREYKHKEEFQVNDPMRGGPYSSDHVDILGNVDTTTDVLKIVTGFDEVQDRIVSEIEQISSEIETRKNTNVMQSQFVWEDSFSVF